MIPPNPLTPQNSLKPPQQTKHSIHKTHKPQLPQLRTDRTPILKLTHQPRPRPRQLHPPIKTPHRKRIHAKRNNKLVIPANHGIIRLEPAQESILPRRQIRIRDLPLPVRQFFLLPSLGDQRGGVLVDGEEEGFGAGDGVGGAVGAFARVAELRVGDVGLGAPDEEVGEVLVADVELDVGGEAGGEAWG